MKRLTIGLALLLGGCSTIGFYGQAVRGHFEVMGNARPVEQVIRDPRTSDAVRHKLRLTTEVRRYARDRLGMDVGRQYTRYSDIGRRHVVWNVFATPALSLDAKTWCYPVAGCVGYRGYFAESEARAYADSLRREGYDVHVGGVGAYSTLGWFSDPILNSFTERPDADLAELLFHELSHATVYLPGDTAFNESFAMAVQEIATRDWLTRTGRQALLEEYNAGLHATEAFRDLVRQGQDELGRIYASSWSDGKKLAAKHQAFERMYQRYLRVKPSLGGFSYDRYFDPRTMNNAKLATVGLYDQWLPSFRELARAAGGHLPTFFEYTRRLTRMSRAERKAYLERIKPR